MRTACALIRARLAAERAGCGRARHARHGRGLCIPGRRRAVVRAGPGFWSMPRVGKRCEAGSLTAVTASPAVDRIRDRWAACEITLLAAWRCDRRAPSQAPRLAACGAHAEEGSEWGRSGAEGAGASERRGAMRGVARRRAARGMPTEPRAGRSAARDRFGVLPGLRRAAAAGRPAAFARRGRGPGVAALAVRICSENLPLRPPRPR